MKRILFMLFIISFLIGCSNDEAYNNSIQKGLDYIASEEYQKAESAFELALDEKKEDEKATVLLSQTTDYQEVIKAIEEGEFDLAKEKANAVIELDGGSSALVKKSEDALALMEDYEEQLAEVTQDYEKGQKQFEDKEYDKAQKTIDSILKQDLENIIFKSVKADLKSLQKDIKSSLEAEAAEEERIAKEKAEAERVSKQKAEEAAREAEKKESESNAFSAEQAIQFAKDQYGNDADTGYDVLDDLEYENGKAYYLIRLYSKEMQAGGGSGTLFLAKVFEDGTVVEEY